MSDVPAAVVLPVVIRMEVIGVAGVVIGIDPHKRSHTAAAVDGGEHLLGQLRVQAMTRQSEVLMDWARRWPSRTWAIEGAHGLGYLLAQQLLAAGERVVDVAPKTAARVRLLDSGQINKTDDNDARSIAISALRARSLPLLTGDDHSAVMRLWARRYRDLGRLRTQVICRLHTLVRELVPGGGKTRLRTTQAIALVERIEAQTPMAQAKLELARELIADLVRIDAQRREARRRTAQAVRASGSTITQIPGVGPIVAGTVLGYVRDINRFPTRDRFASYNGTAPIEVSSGQRRVFRLSRRGNRQLNYVIHMAAVAQIRHRDSEGRAYYDRKIAQGMNGKSALRALKRRISDRIYQQLQADAHRLKDPGGHTGNDSASSAASSHPETPALRTSHSRVAANPRTTPGKQATPTPRPAPARRETGRSAAGVQVEPRPRPRRGHGQDRP
jgi:transposase